MGASKQLIYQLISILIGLFCTSTSIANNHYEAVPGEYVVKLRSNVKSLTLGSFARTFDAKIKSHLSRASQTIVLKKSILERPEAVIAALKKHPMVEIAEPNFIFKTVRRPNDNRLSDLWGLINQEKANGIDLGAEEAWELTTGSRDIIVGVIDSGVDYTLSDLKNNMWTNDAEKNGQAGIDDDGNGYIDDVYGYDFINSDADPMDDNDHGSHCSGTIGAEGDNSSGVAGVNWKVRIMALKFLTRDGSGTLEAAIQAIDYGVENGARILSNSWGGGGYSETLKEAIERAEAKGVLFVTAAGNSSLNNDLSETYPANYDIPNVISVAAIDSDGFLASFSNYGKEKVHIAAPGVHILSTTPRGYQFFDGTSMACPHVAGVAALMLAHNPNLSYQELKDRMMATAKPLASLKNKVLSEGLVNAYNALTNTVPPPDPNDPSRWATAPLSQSSPHPYTNSLKKSYEFTIQGAQKISVHFSKFETENNYDKVIVKDPSGKVYGTMTGNLGANFSPVVDGETLILEFQSDSSVVDYGFDVDKVAYKLPGEDINTWRSQVEDFSTAHPYPNLFEDEQVFTIPGASEVRLQFGQFNTEAHYDKVTFFDGQDKELATWDGNHNGQLSPIAQGDTIKLHFESDHSVTGYGFDLESISYH